MKNIKIILLIVICCAISLPGLAQNQNTNIQLASKYYQNGEYEKALTLYEDLYESTQYKSYRDMYLSCLNLLHEYEAAEKFLKKEIKKKKNDIYLYVDLGMVYYNTNKISESNEQFSKAKELALASETSVANTANGFLFYRQSQHAIDLYEKAAKKFNKNYGLEIGNIYSTEKNFELMMKNYLSYLNGNTLEKIEARLTTVIANDTDDKATPIIEKAIIEELQKKASDVALNNLIIWLYVQTGRYELALNQLIAYDKRQSNNDLLINNFGNSMVDIQNYPIALKAFDYLIKKKPRSALYNEAYIGFLEVSYKQITSELTPDRNKLNELDSTMSVALDEIAATKSYKIVVASAQLKAFYLEKYDEAIELVNNAISSNYYKAYMQELKMLLGDIYFLNNNPWDATLLYAQVEKSKSATEIVNEARYRKAKLAYYTGQFQWAQAQLDVLKAGTSRLISNDAIELSLFITENYDLDTTETTMKTFARADFYAFSKQYEKALQSLDTIADKYPSHSLIDDVIYRKAKIYEQTNDLEKSATLYKEVFTKYSFDILADNSLFAYAEICNRQGKTEEAKDAYFKLISDYPGSIYTVDARKKLRTLSNDTSTD